ncbi:TetR family transcriptional regulator [Mycolicibacterium sp. GF69]|uniref:TetR/AcrR family transcriptional regulator n=1 Tax=Mycolicibacterium sp. GF69 TaxID=2267251 RepID=UPI000DCAFE08|nr:TetR family transcriptional regulator [Mycolicibacterium sp. GF69]
MLGANGARGLSHPKVDQRAGVPDGTTSFYFRTRKALIQGIAERLTELDLADLLLLTSLADDDASGYAGTAGLATLVMFANTEPYLTRSRARYELTLHLSREPELGETLSHFVTQFYALARNVIREWHAADSESNEPVIDEQADMLLTFINGVMMSFVSGTPVVRDAEHLQRWLEAILAGATATREPRPDA